MAKRKVKWEKIGGFGSAFRFEKEGTVLEGVYQKTQIIKIDGRPVKTHHILNGNSTVTVMGTVLDKLSLLPKNTEVRITFNGMAGKGKRKYKSFDIEIPEGTKVRAEKE